MQNKGPDYGNRQQPNTNTHYGPPCNYSGRNNHRYEDCWKRQSDMARQEGLRMSGSHQTTNTAHDQPRTYNGPSESQTYQNQGNEC